MIIRAKTRQERRHIGVGQFGFREGDHPNPRTARLGDSRKHDDIVQYDQVVKAGFGDFDRPVRIGGQDVRPLDVLNAVIARNLAENADKVPPQESNEIHFAIGRGRIGGKPATVRYEVILRPDALCDGYLDAGTSMTASIAAQLILRDLRKPGVYGCEGYFDVDAYFLEARKRKFAIEMAVTVYAPLKRRPGSLLPGLLLEGYHRLDL